MVSWGGIKFADLQRMLRRRAQRIQFFTIATQIILDLFFLFMMCIPGGVLNRMRGSDGGMFAAGSWNRYWPQHLFTRAVMAFPSGAFFNALTGEPLLATFFTITTYASIFIGWGCYFGMGEDEAAWRSRAGVFDWFLGRSDIDLHPLSSWSFSHRWVRDYAGMCFRGLLWTAPAGYMLRNRGYGWQFALSGAAMPVIYSIGFNSDIHNPSGNGTTEFAFGSGVPASETSWGIFMWAIIASTALALPNARPAHKVSKTFEVFNFGLVVFWFCSILYYASVRQCDENNWGQSWIGLLVCTAILAWQQVVIVWRYWRYRIFEPLLVPATVRPAGSCVAPPRDPTLRHDAALPALQVNPDTIPETDEVNNSSTAPRRPWESPGEGTLVAVRDPLLPSARVQDRERSGSLSRFTWLPQFGLRVDVETLFSSLWPPGVSPYREVRNLIGIFAVGCFIIGVAFAVSLFFSGFGHSRYCVQLALPCGDACVGQDVLNNLATGCQHVISQCTAAGAHECGHAGGCCCHKLNATSIAPACIENLCSVLSRR